MTGTRFSAEKTHIPLAKKIEAFFISKTRDVFTLDVRSLAVFRMGFGLILLADLAIRAQALTAHYTDSGVFPREVASHFGPGPSFFLLHFLGGTWQFEAVLFLIAAVFAAMLLVPQEFVAVTE